GARAGRSAGVNAPTPADFPAPTCEENWRSPRVFGEGNATTRFHQNNCQLSCRVATRRACAAAQTGATDRILVAPIRLFRGPPPGGVASGAPGPRLDRGPEHRVGASLCGWRI